MSVKPVTSLRAEKAPPPRPRLLGASALRLPARQPRGQEGVQADGEGLSPAALVHRRPRRRRRGRGQGFRPAENSTRRREQNVSEYRGDHGAFCRHRVVSNS